MIYSKSGCSYEALTYLFGQNISILFLSANKTFLCLGVTRIFGSIRDPTNKVNRQPQSVRVLTVKPNQSPDKEWILLSSKDQQLYFCLRREEEWRYFGQTGFSVLHMSDQSSNNLWESAANFFLAQTAYQSWTIMFIWWRAIKQNKAKPTKNN